MKSFFVYDLAMFSIFFMCLLFSNLWKVKFMKMSIKPIRIENYIMWRKTMCCSAYLNASKKDNTTIIIITFRRIVNFHIKLVFEPILKPYFYYSFKIKTSHKFIGYLRKAESFVGMLLCGTSVFNLLINCFLISETFSLFIIDFNFWLYFFLVYCTFRLTFLQFYNRPYTKKLLTLEILI